MLAQVNGWNPTALEALRSHPTIAHLRGKVASQSLTREQLAAAVQMHGSAPSALVNLAAALRSAPS
jgi:hypothetical protein